MTRAKRGLIVAPLVLLAACSAVTGLTDYSVCDEAECGDASANVGVDAPIITTPTDATSSGSIDASTDVQVEVGVDAGVDAAKDAGCTNCDSGVDSPPPPPMRASCKELHDLDNVVADGVQTLAGGKSVYCNMTLAGGGWTLIANTPPAAKGYWEDNVQQYGSAGFVTNLALYGIMLPSVVDTQGLNYTEVMFLDTGLGNWFIVDSQNDFYRHNYKGSCGDGLVFGNKLFGIKTRSGGGGSLYAWWANGCPNGSDTITMKNQSCGEIFINFDKSCINIAGTLVQAFVR